MTKLCLITSGLTLKAKPLQGYEVLAATKIKYFHFCKHIIKGFRRTESDFVECTNLVFCASLLLLGLFLAINVKKVTDKAFLHKIP